MGSPDPRLNSFGKQDFCLGRQTCSYSKVDHPPVRVKPLLICIVLRILDIGLSSSLVQSKALANLTCIVFYFCLHTGEYTGTTSDDHAFSLDDIGLYSLNQRLSLRDTPDHLLRAATHVTYTFTKQKNMNDGQVIAHSRSGNHLCFPVLATICQVLLLFKYCHWFNQPFLGLWRLASYF